MATYRKLSDSSETILERESDIQIHFTPLQYSKSKFILTVCLSIITGGIYYFIIHWNKSYWMISMRNDSNFEMADCIMVNRNGILDEIPIQYQGSIRFFEYKKQRYLYRRDLQCYKKQESKLKSISPSKLRSLRFGHTTNDSNELKLLNGPNRIVIDNIPITTHLLIKCTHPFYVFQMASVLIWMGGGYVTYAILIFVMSVTSVTWEIYSLKVNEYQLKMMVEDIADFKVIRDKKVVTVGSDELVIGDAVVLEYTGSDTGIKLPCDMALIQGECVVDESSLTGETIPIRKLPIPPTRNESETIFDIDRQRGQVLFGGSYITELKPKKFETVDITTSQSNQLETHDQTLVVAIVLSTGFSTSKGQLFQSILFPSEIEFKFNRDSMKFLKMLGCVAFLAFLNRLVSSILHHERLWDTVFTSLDLITIAVPPALPLILTVGIGFSIQRLKLLKIFCIDPERLNFAGRLDTMCWDKTGTLTVSNLIFAGVDRKQQEVEVDGLKFHHSFILNENSLERLMITCHGLNQQGDKLTGHALDIEQFQQTGWNVHNRNHTTNHLGFTIPVLATFFQPNFPSKVINLIKRYEFDAHLQRSSVIIQSESENQLIMYSKGSPESIKSVCRVDTIPIDFENVCNQYSIEGYYVIACAGKPITTSTDLITSLDRNEVEENLNFMGFMLFQNPIKSESRQVFNQLRLANVKPIIITGDNALTAIHVARHLNMCKLTFLIDFKNNELCFSQIVSERGQMDIELSNTHLSLSNPISRLKSMLDDIEYPELSITSLALQELIKSGDLDLLEYLMPLISIFARAKPDQKTWIIEWLIKHGRYVGMCGDGTNDCGALKAAHVGVALSTAEASIVAPFTSANKNVMDVIELIREGRCALETSFVGFKYMTLYPIIQLIMTATLNEFNEQLSNNQFLFDDMAIVTILALFSLYTKPKNHLTASRPTDDLFNPQIVWSLIGQLICCIFFFIMNLYLTTIQGWYCSGSKATQFLDQDLNPIDPSRGVLNYPCYPLIPNVDGSKSLVTKSFNNTSVWLFTHFQFAIVIMSISVTSQFRLPVWTNRYFTFYWICIMSFLFYLLLFIVNNSVAIIPGPDNYDGWLSYTFNIVPGIPTSFRLLQSVLLLVHLCVSCVWEFYLERRYVGLNEYMTEDIENHWGIDRQDSIMLNHF